ncbi:MULTISPECIES: hypothetical protein [Paraburkholderia]|uniref:DUF2218 domain-containing protein n=1 Tax=Paraburkholderia acidicola TaxID=1912599 RepID=A0ABV1LYH6_9BURK
MSIQVNPGGKRELAETLGRYFEVRRIPFDLDERMNGTLHIHFHVDERDASVTVSFEGVAYDAFTHGAIVDKRHALMRIEHQFAQWMERRAPAMPGGVFRITRF